jgi:hypothetical protein
MYTRDELLETATFLINQHVQDSATTASQMLANNALAKYAIKPLRAAIQPLRPNLLGLFPAGMDKGKKFLERVDVYFSAPLVTQSATASMFLEMLAVIRHDLEQ